MRPNGEVFELVPSAKPTDVAHQLLWDAPGSLFIDRVARAWSQRGALGDLAQVTGPWAVILWDPRTAEHVMVVDPIGVQPLYWARTSTGGVVASSWLDRLLERPDVDDSLDYEGVLLDSVAGLHGEEISHRTRFAAVSRVPWGRAVRVRGDGSVRVEQYWDPRTLAGPDPSLTLDDAAELLRDTIDAAVRRLTPADNSVGSHVSGGLDCTAVACRGNQVLAESGGSLVAGYSWAPDEREVPRFVGDERTLLDDVAAQESLDVRTVYQDESGDWLHELDPDRYCFNTHNFERFVLPQASADGIHIMLSGWGGDELASFNGRAVLKYLARHLRLRALWNQTSQRTKLNAHEPVGFSRQLRVFGAAMLTAVPDPITDLRHRERARQRKNHDSDIDAMLRSASPLAADVWRDRRAGFEGARNHHEYQLGLLTGGHLQRRCDDWYQTGRLFDVFYRYPLLDLDVVTASLQLPWWAFRSHGWTRTAFRMAVEPWVPPSVAWNISKTEPALFAPPERMPVERKPHAGRTVRPDDQRYQDMLDIARRVSLMGMGTEVTPRPVRARADAAPSTGRPIA